MKRNIERIVALRFRTVWAQRGKMSRFLKGSYV